jgi:hypothetical protein
VSADLSTLPARVGQEIEAQREALRCRVETSGLYRHELQEFEVAVAAWCHLLERLGVAEDLGTLTTPESRNVVRRVRLRDDTAAVLKVIGNTREPGEGELLGAWHRAGLPCVEPLAWGYRRVSLNHPEVTAPRTATYLLTRFVEARFLPEAHTARERAQRACDLVAFVRPFHAADVRVSRARSWSDRLGQHLRETLPLLRRYHIREPERWVDKLDRLSSDGPILVHGDPAGRNVLDSDHGLLLLDPPGSLIALPEADVAQICCQVGRVEGVRELLTLVAEQNPGLDSSALAGFAGLNVLVWAGYLLADHSNPDVRRTGKTDAVIARTPSGPRTLPTRADPAWEDAERYLQIARQLLDEYQIP